MKNAEQIANTLVPHITKNNASIGETNRRRVQIGDGQGNARPDNPLYPREVFYRSAQDQNDRGVALLASRCPVSIQAIDGYYNEDVWICNVPGSSYPMIVDIADIGGLATGGPTPSEGTDNSAAFPDQSRIVLLRISPSFAGGISVYVDVGSYAVAYQTPTGITAFVTSIDFAFDDPTDSLIYNPTTTDLSSGEHRIIGIALDPSTGNLVAIPGAAATASGTLPQRGDFVEADYTAISFSGYYPAGYVYRYFGQTTLVEDDMLRLFDPRVLMSKVGIGNFYQFVEVDDVLQNQRAILDLVAGSGATLTPTDDPTNNRTIVLVEASGSSSDAGALYVAWSAF